MSLLPDIAEGPSGDLFILAPAGVEVVIINAFFEVVGRGPAPLAARLPEGLYTVRFSALGRRHEERVTIKSGTGATTVQGGDFAGQTKPDDDSPALRQAQSAHAMIVADRQCRVVMIVRAPEGRSQIDPSRSVRLDGTGARPFPAQPQDRDDELGVASRRYDAEPGIYLLGYESAERRRLEQSLHVFPGRRTIAYLEYGAAQRLVNGDKGYARVRRRGLDPRRTLLLSVSDDEAAPDPECLRRAQILLHAVDRAGGTLDLALVAPLMRADACPYLRTYALAALVRRVEYLTRPTGSLSGPEVKSLVAFARDLIQSEPGAPRADTAAAAWRLQSLGVSTSHGQDDSPLSAPPLLQRSWRWICEQSIGHPDIAPKNPVFRAAVFSRAASAPWLTWRRSAMRASPPPSTLHDGEVENVQALLAASRKSEAWRSPAGLSPRSAQFVNVVASETGRLAGDWTDAEARAVAVRLGTPANFLEERAMSATRELADLSKHSPLIRWRSE